MGPPVESSNCCACGVKRCVVGILIMGIALLGGLTGGTIVYLFHHSFHHHRINLTASECGNIHNNIKHITQNRSGLHNDTVSASPIVSGMKVPGDGREAAVSIGPQFAAPTTLNTVAVTQSLSTTVLTSASNPLTTLVSSTTPYTTQVASESSVVQPRTPTSSIDKDQTSNPTTSTLILSTLSVTQEIHDNSSQPQIDSSTSHANNYSAVSPDNDTVLTTTTVNSQISDRNEYIVYNESGNANGDVASQVVVDSKNDTNNSYDGYDENGVDYDNDSEESSEIGEDIDVLHLNKSSGVTEPQTTTIDTLHVDPNSIVNKITRNMRIGDGSHAHHKMESNEALKVPLNKFPKFFDPILYEVMFDYDEVTLKMNGRLNLTFNVVQASASVFFLHQFHLFFSITEDLRPKFIEYGSNREFPWQELEVNSTQGTIAFYMEKEFKYGANYTLVLNFHTHNICKIEGVMCSQAPSNNHWQFVTNFEPAFARFLFPCLDQPDMKANFRIGMTYTNFDDGFSILGNEDICSDYNIGKKRTVVFCDTVKMPTYLVVLAFGRFETFCSYAANSMKMCIYVEDSPKLVPRGIGAKLIEDFVYIFQVVQDYFEVPYLMSKLDFVFMRDFNNAGMEFFGTILFHIDDFFETIFQTGIIDYTSYRLIVHEVVHLWIGDSGLINY